LNIRGGWIIKIPPPLYFLKTTFLSKLYMVMEENKFNKLEQSVEEIKEDISTIQSSISQIKSALLGNELSGDKGLTGQLITIKTEVEALKADVKKLTEENIKKSEFIKLITWLSIVIGTGVIGFILNQVLIHK
jgi:hypothetical protein